jgi:hypothetical protein
MTAAWTRVVIGVLALVIAVLGWTVVYFARDEWGLGEETQQEAVNVASTAEQEGGRTVVKISPASQAASGIAVQPLAAASSEDFVEAYGSVVSIQPLLETRGRYLVALGEVKARSAAAGAARADYRRMQALYADDRNVSEQALRTAEARYNAESAQLAAAQAAASSLEEALRVSWGNAITQWVRGNDSRVLQRLLERRSHLLVVAFPFDLPAPSSSTVLSVAPVSARDRTRPARYVSAAPQSEGMLPGQTFFFLVDGADLRAGTRVVARIASGNGKQSGVSVPREAVVWHAGQAWVYQKRDEDSFVRQAVSATREAGRGWFNAEGILKAGDEVVVSGAQLLLSEELKFQIRNENED